MVLVSCDISVDCFDIRGLNVNHYVRVLQSTFAKFSEIASLTCKVESSIVGVYCGI
jgi:hypothetical protein